MRAGLRATALVLVALLAPGAALAAADDLGGLLWEAANLALLFAVLIYFARKPVLGYLAERRDGVRNNLETAEKLLTDADERLKEWNRRAARLDEEVTSIREAAHRSAEREAATIVAEARELADRIRANARDSVGSEVRRARRALRAEAGELAVELAAEILRAQVGDEDRDRLVDEFVAKLEQGGPH